MVIVYVKYIFLTQCYILSSMSMLVETLIWLTGNSNKTTFFSLGVSWNNLVVFQDATKTFVFEPSNMYYPASDRNLEIWLAETNTMCSDIMLPY